MRSRVLILLLAVFATHAMTGRGCTGLRVRHLVFDLAPVARYAVASGADSMTVMTGEFGEAAFGSHTVSPTTLRKESE